MSKKFSNLPSELQPVALPWETPRPLSYSDEQFLAENPVRLLLAQAQLQLCEWLLNTIAITPETQFYLIEEKVRLTGIVDRLSETKARAA